MKTKYKSLIAEVMADKGVSVRALAEKTGLSKDTIQRAKSDISGSSFGTMEKIAEALGVRVSDLYEEQM